MPRTAEYARDPARHARRAREWEARNPGKASAYKRAYKARLRAWLDSVKRARGCCDCGTTAGRLDFDHRPGTIKLFNPTHLNRGRAGLEAEIAKCDVRCVACHARRHGIERGGINAPATDA